MPLLERVDDANAIEVVKPRQVLGVEDLDAGFGTRGENQGIPERCSPREMKLLRADQNLLGRQHESQQIPELGETIPRVRRGESLLAKLARGRDEFAGDLPEEDAIFGVGDQVQSDLLAA